MGYPRINKNTFTSTVSRSFAKKLLDVSMWYFKKLKNYIIFALKQEAIQMNLLKMLIIILFDSHGYNSKLAVLHV